jgi:hypothetical protein
MAARRQSERPTLAPGFDLEQFARDSDRRLTSVAPGPTSVAPAPASGETFSDEEPGTTPSATRLATRPRWGAVLTNDAWARSMVGLPVVVMTNDGLKRLPLDHRAGFVISLMDGSLDLDTIVDLCGMDREEALGIIRDLFESGVVEFR